MLSVSEAIAAILGQVGRLPVTEVPLMSALGQVLAEETCADLDSPPFDKSLMDGFAVRAADIRSGAARLRLIEEVTAGQVPQKSVSAGEATRIMTGAPLPAGADAVVPVEQARSAAGQDLVDIVDSPTEPGRNVLPKGASTRAGDRVLPAGRLLRAQELGALAELGRAVVPVYRRPRVAVLATGDELVPVEETPGPGQIRNSNETMLAAQLRLMGAEPVPLGVARDRPDELRERIARGLTCDLLLLSGGVSAGKLDLVPGVLTELGVRQVFHKVRLKPGQPLWFGTYSREQDARDAPGATAAVCHVFGLPGNPVSSMVCCELFVRTALRRLQGQEPAELTPVQARLTGEQFVSGNRPTYYPSQLEWTPGGALVTPVTWVGSSDLRATVEANSMALFSEGGQTYAAGTIVDVFLW